jgi:DNA-binding MarR family transcriptional regulator
MNSSNNHIQLLVRLGESFSSIAKEIKLQHGQDYTCFTPALDKVLTIIGDDETINVKHIATFLSITSGAATQHIAALEKEGAITRVANPDDRREVILHLTQKGKEAYERIKTYRLQLLQQIFSGLDDKELTLMVDLITKASKNILIKEIKT